MTLEISTEAVAGCWRPRSATDVIRDQVAGIDAWHAARRERELAEEAEDARVRSRESRLDVSRRLDVLRRQHQAIVEHTDQQLRRSSQLLRHAAPVRAVIVHRNDWFQGKVVAGLQSMGIEVVARLDNGADAVGVTVAEQPDLLLVEDKLPMINGDEVIRQVRAFAPGTIAAAQVSTEGAIPAMLEAGAQIAFARRVPPTDVAADLAELVRV